VLAILGRRWRSEEKIGRGKRSGWPCGKMPPGLRLRRVCLCFLVMMVVWVPGLLCLRCYVCGGNSGSTCQGPRDGADDDEAIEDPVQECNDLINNRGCVKQYVNGVVLLRGCWLDGTNKCLRNGAAEVCTCNRDLCNSGRTSAPLMTSLLLLPLVTLLISTPLWQWALST